ncbi:hypothetical protein RHSIM_Rhsim04G0031800 [Rhododendron simsii]|uniref:Uncharacterized protein n=1 Tax=Rhododendron simsii TaxID=118357 RepID=A0A834LP88_RHOSS|nr:hypothetical protein RHSIM_Rhsim04G0031800 [Rhododendron simsii]
MIDGVDKAPVKLWGPPKPRFDIAGHANEWMRWLLLNWKVVLLVQGIKGAELNHPLQELIMEELHIDIVIMVGLFGSVDMGPRLTPKRPILPCTSRDWIKLNSGQRPLGFESKRSKG